jgi:hypothetical protein
VSSASPGATSTTTVESPAPSLFAGPPALVWRELDGDRGLGNLLSATSTAGDEQHGWVTAGSHGANLWEESDTSWWSANGRDWQKTNVKLSSIQLGPSGFVGSYLWGSPKLSADGRNWESAFRLSNSQGALAGVVGNRIVAVVSDGRVMVSGEGANWQQLPTTGGVPVLPDSWLTLHDRAIVLAMQPGEQTPYTGPVEVWSTSDGSAWQHVADLPDSANEVWPPVIASDGVHLVVLGGYAGWVDWGNDGRKAWVSDDGLNWSVVAHPPIGALNLAATTSGFVAVGECSFPRNG